MARKTTSIDPRGRRRLTRNQKVGAASLATIVAVAAVGVVAALLLTSGAMTNRLDRLEQAGLLARSVVVVDTDGTVKYTQLVDDITTEPDYDSAVAALG